MSNEFHGLSSSPEYVVWTGIKGRCYNPNASGYSDYGGRGIRMCERWLTSFSNFYADMGPKPSPDMSIERIDTNGNYEPGNCMWTDAHHQTRNRRNNVYYELNGERMILADWAARYGMQMQTLRDRILLQGLTLEQALSRPVMDNRVYVEFRGERLTHTQAAARIGISLQGFQGRLKRGMSVEEAMAIPVAKRTKLL